MIYEGHLITLDDKLWRLQIDNNICWHSTFFKAISYCRAVSRQLKF